jgi:acyl-CoA thioester hydrolase
VGAFDLDGEVRNGRHEMAVRVYYEDTDFSGVVYHANYLRFMERGRTNYLRLIGADHRSLFEETEREAPGFAFVVRSMAVEFLRPARMDDILKVITEAAEVRGASMTLRQQVARGERGLPEHAAEQSRGELLVEAEVRVAFVCAGRARPIPKALRAALQADFERRSRP